MIRLQGALLVPPPHVFLLQCTEAMKALPAPPQAGVGALNRTRDENSMNEDTASAV